MAVDRKSEQPKCFQCGQDIQGKYLDQSDRQWNHVLVGDTFQGWDFEGHKKVCKGSIKDYLKRSGVGEYRIAVDEAFGYIHPLGRDGETYDFKL